MQKVHLFNTDGASVVQVDVPSLAPPGIVIWKGMAFRLEQGRYVFSTVYHATDTDG